MCSLISPAREIQTCGRLPCIPPKHAQTRPASTRTKTQTNANHTSKFDSKTNTPKIEQSQKLEKRHQGITLPEQRPKGQNTPTNASNTNKDRQLSNMNQNSQRPVFFHVPSLVLPLVLLVKPSCHTEGGAARVSQESSTRPAICSFSSCTVAVSSAPVGAPTLYNSRQN